MEDIFGSLQVLANRQVLKYQRTGVSATVLTDGAIYDGYPLLPQALRHGSKLNVS
jgi:hypothetical protein